MEDRVRALLQTRAESLRPSGEVPSGLRRRIAVRRAGVLLGAAAVLALTATVSATALRDVGDRKLEPAPAPTRSGAEGACPTLSVIEVDEPFERPIGSPAVCGDAPAWSPDGKTIAFVRHPEGRLADIWWMNATGAGIRRLTVGSGSETWPDWSPDGTTIVVSDDRAESPEAEFSPGDRLFLIDVATGERTRVTDPADDDRLPIELYPRFTPDGLAVAYVAPDPVGRRSSIYSVDLASGHRSLLVRMDDVSFDRFDFSPGGESLVVTVTQTVGPEAGQADLYLFDLRDRVEGLASPARLTDSPGGDGYPAWSPDGDLIAFMSNRDGDDEIWIIRPDGSGERALTDTDADDALPSWAPDGQAVVYRTRG